MNKPNEKLAKQVLALHESGMKKSDIAKELGITRQKVQYYVKTRVEGKKLRYT